MDKSWLRPQIGLLWFDMEIRECPSPLWWVRLLTPALFALTVTGAFAVNESARKNATVDFNRDIRPILSENCFACHGPDENKRKAKLRLDLKDGLFKSLDEGKSVVVPGKSQKSDVFRLVTTTDE